MPKQHEVRCMPRSIVDSFGVPPVHVNVVINPVDRIENLDIPLFAVPHRGAPPVSGGVPRPTGCHDRAMHTMKCDPDGKRVTKLDGGFKWGTKPAQGDGAGTENGTKMAPLLS